MKADTEVYLGIYLIVVWFIGWSNIITIFIFWQLLRIRYMINVNSQAAFRRVDQKIMGYIETAPGFVKTVYMKLRGFMASMGDVES